MENSGQLKKVVKIFLILILVFVGGIFYIYNFHVFETFRVCLSVPQDTEFECSSNVDCVFEENFDLGVEGVPIFLSEKFQEVADSAVYCESTCKVREILGFDSETGDFEILDSCKSGEKEISLKIHGKEALEIWEFLNLEDN